MEIKDEIIFNDEKENNDETFIRLKNLQLLIKKESYINELCK